MAREGRDQKPGDIDTDVCDRVRWLMDKKCGGSRTAMAREIHMDVMGISRVVRGHRNPGRKLVAAIVQHLGVDATWLLTRRGQGVRGRHACERAAPWPVRVRDAANWPTRAVGRGSRQSNVCPAAGGTGPPILVKAQGRRGALDITPTFTDNAMSSMKFDGVTPIRPRSTAPGGAARRVPTTSRPVATSTRHCRGRCRTTTATCGPACRSTATARSRRIARTAEMNALRRHLLAGPEGGELSHHRTAAVPQNHWVGSPADLGEGGEPRSCDRGRATRHHRRRCRVRGSATVARPRTEEASGDPADGPDEPDDADESTTATTTRPRSGSRAASAPSARSGAAGRRRAGAARGHAGARGRPGGDTGARGPACGDAGAGRGGPRRPGGDRDA